MMPHRIIKKRDQSGPALCRAWVYRDEGPTSYVRCDTPLHCELSSNRVIVSCPWHPDRIYKVLPEVAESNESNPWLDCGGTF